MCYHRGMDDLISVLASMYRAMRDRFGHQRWWPARDHLPPRERKLEICVGAILTQNTNWQNVEKALARLDQADAMSVRALAAIKIGKLAELIRPAGYFNVKARRLRNFIDHVCEACDGDIERLLAQPKGELRRQLLEVNGIGPETADSMVLYAAGRCTFVVDAYTRRVCVRHGLIGPRDGYDAIKAMFESHVPRRVGLCNDYHAQLVAVGKHYCRPNARCKGCPLAGFEHDASLWPPAPAVGGNRT
jgi:endonuclease-3 related protein